MWNGLINFEHHSCDSFWKVSIEKIVGIIDEIMGEEFSFVFKTDKWL